jgi:hypothetical protein
VPRIPLRQTQHRHGAAMMMPKSPQKLLFSQTSCSHYASNLNHKLSAVMWIEDKEKPAYLLGYAYGWLGGTLTVTALLYCCCSQDNNTTTVVVVVGKAAGASMDDSSSHQRGR